MKPKLFNISPAHRLDSPRTGSTGAHDGPSTVPVVRLQGRAGFTLTEMLIAVAIFSMVLMGILLLNVFSLRVGSGVNRMLQLGAQANILNILVADVKSAQTATVETYNGAAFSPIALGQPQQGNALYLSILSGATTNQVYYWVDSTGALFRQDVGANQTKEWMNDITNSACFSSQNFNGNVSTSVISNTVARTMIAVDIYILDSNPQNFTQSLWFQASAEIRNN